MQWIMRKQVVYPDYLDGKTIDFISKVRLSLFLHWFWLAVGCSCCRGILQRAWVAEQQGPGRWRCIPSWKGRTGRIWQSRRSARRSSWASRATQTRPTSRRSSPRCPLPMSCGNSPPPVRALNVPRPHLRTEAQTSLTGATPPPRLTWSELRAVGWFNVHMCVFLSIVSTVSKKTG